MLIPELYTSEQISCTDRSCHASVFFNPHHPLYRGHFPGEPVTPGVCLIQAATELLSGATGSALRLISARQIKFLQMHHPEAPLRFELTWSEKVEWLHGRISIFHNDSCIAKIDAQFEQT